MENKLGAGWRDLMICDECPTNQILAVTNRAREIQPRIVLPHVGSHAS